MQLLACICASQRAGEKNYNSLSLCMCLVKELLGFGGWGVKYSRLEGRSQLNAPGPFRPWQPLPAQCGSWRFSHMKQRRRELLHHISILGETKTSVVVFFWLVCLLKNKT